MAANNYQFDGGTGYKPKPKPKPKPTADMYNGYRSFTKDTMLDAAAKFQVQKENAAEAANQLNLPKPPGGSPRGGGGGGGGMSAIAGRQATALQQLLGSSAFRAKEDVEGRKKITDAVAKDKAGANSAYDALAAALAGMTNPFQNLSVTPTPAVQPELAALLGANGADARAYQAEVGLANALAEQSRVNAQQTANTLGAAETASQQSRRAETEMGRTYAGQQIGAQETAMLEALRQRQVQRQDQLDQQKMQVVMELINAMAQGGQSVDVSQFFK